MDHDHDVFDKNDMLLILFLGSVMDAIKKQLANQPKPSYKLGWWIHVHICSYHYVSQINVLLEQK